MNEALIDRTALVIFGVTGDLAYRKLIPAIYQLHKTGQIKETLFIHGFARRDWDHTKLQSVIRESIQSENPQQVMAENIFQDIAQRVRYIQSDFDDDNGYQRLSDNLEKDGIRQVLFYLATPPESYIPIIQQIGRHDLNREAQGWKRIIIEKPYGTDTDSAEELETIVHSVFSESQVYRIDHYLGKETVQNILVFRFANGIFEPLWNRQYIDHIQITVAEEVGVESRANYYEKAGAIRDVFQNHLLQLLALTAMEAPASINARSVRDEKVKVLQALKKMQGKGVIQNTVRGQYVSGLINEARVKSYRDEPGVSPTSTTETYMAGRLFVDSWRWSGVPFYYRTGKRLAKRLTEIAIQFKQVPLAMFKNENIAFDAPNSLVLNIQPDEGITLSFGAKQPGLVEHIQPVDMKFTYKETFGANPPEAYQRLLLDCLLGDATLFTRSDEVKAAWAFTTSIIHAWQDYPLQNLPIYEAGTWGPSAADDFIMKDSRSWRFAVAPKIRVP